LLREDWRFDMMKTLDRPESFSKNFQNFFQANINKKENAMLPTGLATVSEMLIIVKYHVAS